MSSRSRRKKQQQAPAKRQRSAIVETRSEAISVHAHQGPIPDPESLAKYQQINPELVPWIIQRASNDQEHIQSLESQSVEAQIADQKASRTEFRHGQTLAFALMLAMVAGGSCVAIFTEGAIQWAGIAVAVAPAIPKTISAFTGREAAKSAKK